MLSVKGKPSLRAAGPAGAAGATKRAFRSGVKKPPFAKKRARPWRDPAGTGADRHERLGEGQLAVEALRKMIKEGAAAGAAVIVETPREPNGLKADLEFVRAAIG